MTWLLAAALSWGFGLVLGLLVPRLAAFRALTWISLLIGCACLAGAAWRGFSGAPQVWEMPLDTPLGPLGVRLDAIAAVFLAPLALIGALATLYATAYAQLGHGHPRPLREPPALALLLLAMTTVIVAAHTILLLMAWEIVTLSSWYLLSSDHRDPEARTAGLHYLIAGQVSAAALALLFVLFVQAGEGWGVPMVPLALAGRGAPSAMLLFVLALVGFGTKAAIAPLHVWLPDAHAAAPSHVSALMSGVLVTLGFYGLVRIVPVLGHENLVWAVVLMALGALGACGGIVMALSQRDVKRVLAYSTIENAGLITLSMGAALSAAAAGHPLLAALAWSAALLHVWNHAVSKALQFFAAGAVAQLVGSRDLERWGGLLKRLPLLGGAMIAGAAALIGLPGTHGFASEWLLLVSLFRGSQWLDATGRLAMVIAVVATTFTVGIAAACFVRVVGIGLLGHPRSAAAAEVSPPKSLRLLSPIAFLAGACIVLTFLVQPMLSLLGRAVEQLVPGAPIDQVHALAAPLPWLAAVVPAGAAVTFLYRMWLTRTRTIRRAVTWDCGYARPTPSMQYTATSLSQPITRVLQPALGTTVEWLPPTGLWPSTMAWASRTPERALAEFYRPIFSRLAELLGMLGRLQEGRVTVYLRYFGVALLALFVWFFLPSGAAP